MCEDGKGVAVQSVDHSGCLQLNKREGMVEVSILEGCVVE